jgi:hypothetical protein
MGVRYMLTTVRPFCSCTLSTRVPEVVGDRESPCSRATYAWDPGRRRSAASSGRLLAPVLAIAR